MRPDLEDMEQIESYLRNEMGASDRLAFEAQMQNSSELKRKVEGQKNLMKGIERKVFKANAQLAFKKFQWIRKLWIGGGITAAVLLVAGIGYALFSNPEESKEFLNPEIPQQDSIANAMEQNAVLPKPPVNNCIPVMKSESLDTATFSATTEMVDTSIGLRPSKNETTVEYREAKPHKTAKQVDTLWSGKSEADEKVNMLIAKFSVAEVNTMMLLKDATIHSSIAELDGTIWMFNDKKTKITIGTQSYPVKWTVKDKSFKLKVSVKNATYNFVFTEGADASIDSSVKMDMKMKNKKN